MQKRREWKRCSSCALRSLPPNWTTCQRCPTCSRGLSSRMWWQLWTFRATACFSCTRPAGRAARAFHCCPRCWGRLCCRAWPRRRAARALTACCPWCVPAAAALGAARGARAVSKPSLTLWPRLQSATHAHLLRALRAHAALKRGDAATFAALQRRWPSPAYSLAVRGYAFYAMYDHALGRDASARKAFADDLVQYGLLTDVVRALELMPLNAPDEEAALVDTMHLSSALAALAVWHSAAAFHAGAVPALCTQLRTFAVTPRGGGTNAAQAAKTCQAVAWALRFVVGMSRDDHIVHARAAARRLGAIASLCAAAALLISTAEEEEKSAEYIAQELTPICSTLHFISTYNIEDTEEMVVRLAPVAAQMNAKKASAKLLRALLGYVLLPIAGAEMRDRRGENSCCGFACCAHVGDGAPATLAVFLATARRRGEGGIMNGVCAALRHAGSRVLAARLVAYLLQQSDEAREALAAAGATRAVHGALMEARAAAIAAARRSGRETRVSPNDPGGGDDPPGSATFEPQYCTPHEDTDGASLCIIDAALAALSGTSPTDARTAAAEKAAAELLAEEEAAAQKKEKQGAKKKGSSARRRAAAAQAAAAAPASEEVAGAAEAVDEAAMAAALSRASITPPAAAPASGAALQHVSAAATYDVPHEDDDLCVVCLDGPREAVLGSCAHPPALCCFCVARLLATDAPTCPLCRAPAIRA